MTQSELWLANGRKPSTSWKPTTANPPSLSRKNATCAPVWKHNKKLMNAGELKPERMEIFKQLLELWEKYKHVNQYH